MWAAYFIFWSVVNLKQLMRMDNPWRPVQIVLIFQCLMIAFFFIIRKPAKTTSWSFYDFIISSVGTFTPYLFMPVNHGTPNLAGEILQVVGSLMTLSAFLSLRRSIGFLPANRGIQSQGLYRIIRHPVYLSYQIFHTGYLLNQWSTRNLIICVVGVTAEILRIFAEEKLLLKDSEYAAYAQTVKWRLIPFIF